MSTETIPGGAYRNADGTWVNAHGKKIAPPKGLPKAEAPAEPSAEAGGEGKPETAAEKRERLKAEKEAAKKEAEG